MIKRAPDNVRYLGQFGEHILTRSFTARDPTPTFVDQAQSTAGEGAPFTPVSVNCFAGLFHAYPLFRSPAASPLIVR